MSPDGLSRYRRFVQPEFGAPVRSEYDIPSSEIYDPIGRDVAGTSVFRFDLRNAGRSVIEIPGRALAAFASDVNGFPTQPFSARVRINEDRASNEISLTSGRGYNGSFYRLFFYWDALVPLQPPDTYFVELYLFRSINKPWLRSDL